LRLGKKITILMVLASVRIRVSSGDVVLKEWHRQLKLKHEIVLIMKSYTSKLLLLSGLSLLLLAPGMVPLAQAQEEEKFSMNVSLNSDIFFGFYPFFAGSYKLNDKMAFTFYGIQWSGGTGAGWGNWTEFGVGVSLPVGPLTVNPQIGILNGSLTSGLGTPRMGEGFVPNLTVTLNQDKVFGELYSGYYIGLDKGNPNTNNYLHYWLTGGYKINSFVSAGLHFEQLRFMGGNNYPDDAAYNYYVTAGPFIQFSDPAGKSFVRFTGGADLRSDEEVVKSNWKQPNFFKLALGFSL
jgi:hypothetical protein